MDLRFTEHEDAFRGGVPGAARGQRPRAAVASATHGPAVHRARGRLPRRVPGVARSQRAPRAALGRHPRRLRAPPRVGAGAVRRPLRGGVVARGVRRPGRDAHGVADLRGGVLPGGRAPAGHPERHLPARADGVRLRHARAEGPHPPPHGPRRRPVVPGLVGAGRRAATSPASRARPCATRPRRLAALGPEDLDHPRRVLHAPVRAVPQRPGGASATGASPTSSSRSTPTASPCGASAGSTATRASPRCSSTTCFVADDAVLGEVDQGWSVAMATTSVGAWAHPAQPGPVHGHGRPPRRPLPP